MKLGELIAILDKLGYESARFGFGAPMSYRGYYSQLAFAPEENTNAYEMLEHARSAVGQVFEGYKGGLYNMDLDAPVWVAEYGCLGTEITPFLLSCMFQMHVEGGE